MYFVEFSEFVILPLSPFGPSIPPMPLGPPGPGKPGKPAKPINSPNEKVYSFSTFLFFENCQNNYEQKMSAARVLICRSEANIHSKHCSTEDTAQHYHITLSRK